LILGIITNLIFGYVLSKCWNLIYK
jgi:hypothetical protein